MKASTVSRDTNELAARLRLVMARLVRRARQEATTMETTPSMLSALSIVANLGSPTLGELAAAERVTPPTVTKIVARLEDAGLVAREQDAGDRRIARVRLTDEGRRFVERTRSRASAYMAKRLRTLSDEEREVLAAAVPVLERLLEEER
ncbi:MAG TPA: MarR family transcriptional regulator [Acidimicrobiales bacterium]|nr:MarR family transcriptional regulator [Acidimicrobiales bacterium]